MEEWRNLLLPLVVNVGSGNIPLKAKSVLDKFLLVYDSICPSSYKVTLKDSFAWNLHAISWFLSQIVVTFLYIKLFYYFALSALSLVCAACRFVLTVVLEVSDQ